MMPLLAFIPVPGDQAPVQGLARAIQSATLTGVLVAAVMFVSAVAALDMAAIVVPLFVVAMLALMVALLLLLRETQIATAQLSRRF